ncbi:MAG: exo-alpha-sialidase [Clostridia bacterium]|nr:exo-alpha-sialidase [Clostridia bacterium]
MFKKIAEGDIYCADKDGLVAVGSRVASLENGTLIATYNVETAIGVNDFAPMASYSTDGGITWSKGKYLWPQYLGNTSVYGSVRNTLDGRICFGGTCTPITEKGQSYWSDELGAMLENHVIFALSDDGITFTDIDQIPLAYYGSAENPGGAFVDSDGSINIVYSPYRAIEMKEDPPVNQMVLLRSVDGGKTYSSSVFAQDQPPCQYGESWLIKADKNLYMVGTWQTATKEGSNRFFLSKDNLGSFYGPFILPFNGQSSALEAYKDGLVFIVYNYRSVNPAGVYLALAKINENGFEILANEPVWETEKKTYNNSGGEFNEWTDFAFGEPSVKLLDDGNLLVTLWYDHGDKKGIRYVLLKIEE